MFSTLDSVGLIIQMIGVAAPILGVIVGSLNATSIRFGGGSILIIYALTGVVSGVLMFAFGGLVRVQVSIARDSHRTANALERLVQRQSQQVPTGTRLRQLGTDE